MVTTSTTTTTIITNRLAPRHLRLKQANPMQKAKLDHFTKKSILTYF